MFGILFESKFLNLKIEFESNSKDPFGRPSFESLNYKQKYLKTEKMSFLRIFFLLKLHTKQVFEYENICILGLFVFKKNKTFSVPYLSRIPNKF